MTRVALRGIRSHLGRFLLSVLAVLLGVAFVAGTFALRTMLSTTFSDIIASSVVGDAYLRGAQETSTTSPTGLGTERNRIPLSVADDAERVEGVDRVLPDITGPIVVVGSEGTAVISGNGAPSFAMAMYDDDPSVELVDGRAPQGPDEVALESSTLEASGLAVGDRTTVVVGGALAEVEVVGEAAFAAPLAGAVIVMLDVDTATAAYAPDGTVATMAVYGEEGTTQEGLVDALSAAVGDDTVAAVTGELLREESEEQVQSALGFVSTFLLVFAAISLFVGAFIIANTFQMVVRQRQREYAMLRAVGASPLQVFSTILVQAAVVGLLGSALGVGAGVGLVAALRGFFATMGMELSGRIPLDGFTVVVSVVTGTVVSLVAAAVPARRAALTPPVEAMRDEVVTHDRRSVVRAAAGAVLLVGGIAAVALAVRGTEDAGTVLGLGAASVVVSVLLLAPTVVPAALGVLAAPAVALVRPLGALARGNVTRVPRRTASTASALMIGMALVGAASVLAASTQASTRVIVENESTSDLLVQSATQAVPEEVVGAVAALDGVDRADPVRFAALTVDGTSDFGLGLPAGAFGSALDVEVVEGSTDRMADGEVAVQRSRAEDEGWSVGDTVTVGAGLGERELTIGAVIDSRALGAPVVLPEDVFTELVPTTEAVIDTVFVVAVEGADLDALRDDVTDVVRPYVVVSVLDNEQFADELADQVDQVLVILYALLGLSIVIAVLGIVNTLALSIAERTREIGLLRAVGLGRLQLATVVTIESVLTAVFGTVLGLVVGTGLAATLPQVFADEGLTELAVPWGQLGVLLGLAVVIGAVAALWPAIRAARMDVLDAVSYE
ncbi:ABC transporter permease [Cellulomonas carbonis]|uniref:ABC transporter permease n=1 Tax=Cellulomonas carbonis T26 TaxID=947969 RepID=A0A0A0BU94_9CELL|nr:FtsX-like permease family protein [Cellulomonas carbonis]KGM11988.1 ABC transporter permease [Cellulomonas carbonis T26]GGB98187.1 ABC transporter permease [Cellulomonas carbonis]